MGGSTVETIARAFLDGRARDGMLSHYPGAMPATLVDAYAIQDSAIAQVGRTIGGWKVGRVQDAQTTQFGDDRLAGPVFADAIVQAADEDTAMPVLSGFAAVEAELMIRLDGAHDSPLSIEQVAEHVAEIRLGIEIASSPFAGINDHGPAVCVSDFGNNHGLLLGPALADWRSIDLMDEVVRTEIDGAEVGSGRLSGMLDGPFGAVAWLTRHLAARGRSLGRGWVSSGAITGVHRVRAGQSALVRFGDHAAIGCRTVAAPPTGAAL